MTRPISEMTRAELVDEVVRLQQRNADLAAHVERLSEWLARDPEDDEGSWMDDGWEIHASSPEASLARLKAQWQAEAVVEFGFRYGPETEVRADSQRVANKIRQAEGGEV